MGINLHGIPISTCTFMPHSCHMPRSCRVLRTWKHTHSCSFPVLLVHLLTADSVNTLPPGRCGCNVQLVIFKFTSSVDILSISYGIALRWMPQDPNDDQSALVQVMAWCPQAPSHYLSPYRPRFMLLHGITSPQWVNTLKPRQNGQHSADNICKWIFLNENCDSWI